MSQAVEFHHLTSGVANTARQAVIETQFVDDNGKPVDFDGVKKGVAVAKVAAADAVAAAGAAPTKAEYDAVVTELNETKRQLNALLASLTAAGTIA